MSKYDKEREAMGLSTVASSTPSSTGKSKYDADRAMYKNGDEESQYANAMKSAYESNPDSFTNPTNASFADEAQGFNAPDDNGNFRTDFPGGIINPLNDLNRLNNSPLLRSFNRGAGKTMGVPDDMMDAAKTSFVPSSDSFNKLSAANLPENNSTLGEKITGFLGSTAGFLTNPAQLEQNVGQTFFGNQFFGNLGAKVGNTIESKLPQNFIGKAAGNLAKQGTIGALGSAAYAPFQTLNSGGDVQDIPRAMLEQGLTGGVLGGGTGAVGSLGKSGFSAIADRYAGTKLGDALGKFFGKGTAEVQPQQQQDILALPPGRGDVRYQSARGRSNLDPNVDPIYGQGDIHTFELPEGNYTPPTRFKMNNAEDAFHSAYGKVLPAAVERMTPPLENPNELAKWVQGHLNDAGHNVSLNEVRSLSYEDLRQLAEEMKARLNPADVVKRTAHDMGYGQIYDMTTPTIKERIAQDAQKQVYGINPSKVNIARPDAFNVSKTSPAAAPESKIGFTPKQVKPKSKYAQEREQILKETQAVNPPARPAQPEVLRSTPETPMQETPMQKPPTEDVIQTKDPRVIDKVVNFFDDVEQAAKDRIAARGNRLNSLPIDQLADYAIIGASKLVKGTVKFSDWSAAMIKDFGEEIKPHLKDIFNQSKTHIKEAERQASGVAHLPGVNSGIDPLKGNKADIASLEKATENSGEWKDKNRFFLNRETAERNFEDVMGKDAPIMNKTYIEPIHEAAAERQRFITKERNEIKDLGIKYKTSEDALVQKYGENKMTLDELKAESPDNWQKIKTAAETMRSKYDKLLDMANEVLRRNGYPEVPKRKDYFPHYEEVDGLLHKLGFGFEDNTLPAELNGITSNLKPGKNFFSNFQKRKGNDTTLGAMAGFDRYIEGISKVIYQTDNIKRLRGLDKTLRAKHEGTTHLADFLGNLTDYTNILAGKKTELDRSPEALAGRNFYSAADWLKKRVGANMIGGSASAALTNTIPVTQLLAETSKPSVLKGITSAIQHITGNDAIGQESNFLTRRFTSDPLAMGKLDKTQKYAGAVFKAIDHFTSNIVIRSKYYEGMSKGLTSEEAMSAADKYASRMMAERSEGAMPTLFHSKGLGLITQFQLEVNNQFSHLFKDMPKSMSKGKYASALTQVIVYDYLYNQLYEKITGNRPAFDPLGIAVHSIQDFTNPRLSKGKASMNLSKNIGNNLPFMSMITGGGRLPLDAAIPNIFGSSGLISGKAKLGDELMKPVKLLGLPFGGSQINKTITGLNAVSKGGERSKDSNGEDITKYPIAQNMANITRGALFGKSALPETGGYYRNNTPSLTPNETKMLDNAPNKEVMYKNILAQKQLNSLKDKMTKISKDRSLTDKERMKKLGSLTDQYKEITTGVR